MEALRSSFLNLFSLQHSTALFGTCLFGLITFEHTCIFFPLLFSCDSVLESCRVSLTLADSRSMHHGEKEESAFSRRDASLSTGRWVEMLPMFALRAKMRASHSVYQVDWGSTPNLNTSVETASFKWVEFVSSTRMLTRTRRPSHHLSRLRVVKKKYEGCFKIKFRY